MAKIVLSALKRLLDQVGDIEVVNFPTTYRDSKRGAVIVCNHTGWAECAWLGRAFYPRPVHFLAKKELFGSLLFGDILRSLNAIPVEREAPSASSIKLAIQLTHGGELLAVFPSGTRSLSALPFKRGAATIALHARVPLIAAFYKGPPTVSLRDLRRRPQVKLIFGPPLATSEWNLGKHATLQLTGILQDQLDCLGRRSGGFYSTSTGADDSIAS